MTEPPDTGDPGYLQLLHSDPQIALQLYRTLRERLVRFFEWRQCRDCDDLAQETLKRGFAKIATGTAVYAADPNQFFLGIGRMVHMETWGPQRAYQATDEFMETQPSTAAGPDRTVEAALLLEHGLSALTPAERDVLVRYHDGDRATLLAELGIDANALRVRVHRLAVKVRRRLEGPMGAK